MISLLPPAAHPQATFSVCQIGESIHTPLISMERGACLFTCAQVSDEEELANGWHVNPYWEPQTRTRTQPALPTPLTFLSLPPPHPTSSTIPIPNASPTSSSPPHPTPPHPSSLSHPSPTPSPLPALSSENTDFLAVHFQLHLENPDVLNATPYPQLHNRSSIIFQFPSFDAPSYDPLCGLPS